MALEIARLLPHNARVLDVGCGNGFIAHHLSALLRRSVIGVDVGPRTTATIDYVPYDGRHLPLNDGMFDAVLLCYVLHHAQDARLVLNEVSRVLVRGGTAIVYEDMPITTWDRMVCWSHNRRWKDKTGPCSFRLENEWRAVFAAVDFEVMSERTLSRWRNLAHPVTRRFFVLRANHSAVVEDLRVTREAAVSEAADEVYAPA
jgi:SAM-dependent methyltransferase